MRHVCALTLSEEWHMSPRTKQWLASAGLAGCLFLAAAPPARAGIILPDDFVLLQAYALNHCETYNFSSGDLTACLAGTLDFGLNTTSGLYGFIYDVPIAEASGPDSFVSGILCDAVFLSPTSPSRLVFPSAQSEFCGLGGFLGAQGVVYSPELNADYRLLTADAEWQGRPIISRWIRDLPVQIAPITTPEPQSFALLATGLAGLVVVKRRGKRRRI